MLIYNTVTAKTVTVLWPRGQAVKTSPFHGGNTGSIPVGVIQLNSGSPYFLRLAGIFCFSNSENGADKGQTI